jgi:hypothetical protein
MVTMQSLYIAEIVLTVEGIAIPLGVWLCTVDGHVCLQVRTHGMYDTNDNKLRHVLEAKSCSSINLVELQVCRDLR